MAINGTNFHGIETANYKSSQKKKQVRIITAKVKKKEKKMTVLHACLFLFICC